MTHSISTTETTTFDLEDPYMIYRAIINPKLEVRVESNRPDYVEICRYYSAGAVHPMTFVKIKREETQKVIEALQAWLGGKK